MFYFIKIQFMPNTNEHLKIIDNNYRVLNHLVTPDPAKYTNWCVTIIFYMALHYIHAYLAKFNNEHPDNYPALQHLINADPKLKPLYTKYRSLEDDSRKARYDGEDFTIPNMRNDSLKWFRDIQSNILSFLKIKNRQEFNLYTLFPL